MAAPHDEQLDDSPPKLPEDTLKLLQEFLAEQSVSRQSGLTLSNQDGNFGSVKVSEDWDGVQSRLRLVFQCAVLHM